METKRRRMDVYASSLFWFGIRMIFHHCNDKTFCNKAKREMNCNRFAKKLDYVIIYFGGEC